MTSTPESAKRFPRNAPYFWRERLPATGHTATRNRLATPVHFFRYARVILVTPTIPEQLFFEAACLHSEIPVHLTASLHRYMVVDGVPESPRSAGMLHNFESSNADQCVCGFK
jgi:hypothetical protein